MRPLRALGSLQAVGLTLALWSAGLGLGCQKNTTPTSQRPGAGGVAAADPPRLTVVIVVDQLRGDEIEAFAPAWQFGMARLLSSGRWYSHAMHTHGRTETAAGHATIGTGVLPRTHGVVDKGIYLPERRAMVNVCKFADGGCDASAEMVPTMGDRLLAISPDSRVAAVASKARSANLLGGRHANLVVWMPDDHIGLAARCPKGRGVPGWLDNFFAQVASPDTLSHTWALPPMPAALARRASPSPGAWDCGHGTTFPHHIPEGLDAAALRRVWGCTPDSDRAILQTALHVAQHMALGKDDAPDVLWVSLGATDIVGHAYGYESLERAATLVQLDAALGEFFDGLVEAVGPRIVVALTADHGVAPTVPHARAEGFVSGRTNEAELVRSVEGALARFGPGPHVAALAFPFLHLHPAPPVQRQAMAQAAVAALQQSAAVWRAWTPEQLAADPDPAARAMANSYSPARGADVVFALKPYFAPTWGATAELGADHGSPWPYDRHVPVLLWGNGIKAGHIDREVAVIDLMRTLGDGLGLRPLAAGGQPLP